MPTLSQVVKEALADGQQGPVVALEDGRGGHHQLGVGIQARELIQPLCYPVSILLQAMGGSCNVSQRHLACNGRQRGGSGRGQVQHECCDAMRPVSYCTIMGAPLPTSQEHRTRPTCAWTLHPLARSAKMHSCWCQAGGHSQPRSSFLTCKPPGKTP